MLYVKGAKEQDLDRIIVWRTDRGDTVAVPSWSLVEAIHQTYLNMVEANTGPDAAIKATRAVTAAIETGIDLIRLGFAPDPGLKTEIKQKLMVGT